MNFFTNLKPGDPVVYYQWHAKDKWPWGNVGHVRSNDGQAIILEEISGWQFRVSDGNPTDYDKHPELCTYIVPTTLALIARVEEQRASFDEYLHKRNYLAKLNWHLVGADQIDSVWETIRHIHSPGSQWRTRL